MTFIFQLFSLTHSAEAAAHGIVWSRDGTYFTIQDPEEFARTVLPQYYRHNNYTSFVRQLNVYGTLPAEQSQRKGTSYRGPLDCTCRVAVLRVLRVVRFV